MNYKLVINHILKYGFTKILVTGCPRSGTRITTRILADELGFEYHQEERIKTQNIGMLNGLLKNTENFVIQCSGIFPRLNETDIDKKTCIVFASRDFDEIAASFKRLGWKVNGKSKISFYYKYFSGIMPDFKYPAWELASIYFSDYLKPILGKQAIASDYSSLIGSTLFVTADKRARWSDMQTENKS